jgi:hypothetical protein
MAAVCARHTPDERRPTRLPRRAAHSLSCSLAINTPTTAPTMARPASGKGSIRRQPTTSYPQSSRPRRQKPSAASPRPDAPPQAWQGPPLRVGAAGDMLHLDIKPLGRIARIGHRIHGDRRVRARASAASTSTSRWMITAGSPTSRSFPINRAARAQRSSGGPSRGGPVATSSSSASSFLTMAVAIGDSCFAGPATTRAASGAALLQSRADASRLPLERPHARDCLQRGDRRMNAWMEVSTPMRNCTA